MRPELEQSLSELLDELGSGDGEAWARVLPSIYDELKRLARAVAGPEADGSTLTPTALVHEAWVRLSRGAAVEFADRSHFFAVAGRTMRHVLVDRVRESRASKRGGNLRRVTLSGLPGRAGDAEVLDLDEALTALERLSPRQARVVELRFFAGLTVPEVAACFGLSVSTVEAEWRMARAWLGKELG